MSCLKNEILKEASVQTLDSASTISSAYTLKAKAIPNIACPCGAYRVLASFKCHICAQGREPGDTV